MICVFLTLTMLTNCESFKLTVPNHSILAEQPVGPYVEFDMRPLPCDRGGWHLKIKVDTEQVTCEDEVNTGGASELFTICDTFVRRMKEVGFKAEVINKSKIRVYGHTKEGKFYPATKGYVESPDLKKEQLPTVKVVGKKG